MPAFPPRPTSESLHAQNTEAQMRRALGLPDDDQPGDQHAGTERHRGQPVQSRPERAAPTGRRRFVQDGEVPVTVIHRSVEHGAAASSSPSRLAAAEAARQAEHSARVHAERQLQDAQATIRNLQTRLGDLGLARDAALEKARIQQEAADALRSALQECEAHLAAVLASGQSADQAAGMKGARNGKPRGRAAAREAARPDDAAVKTTLTARTRRPARTEKTSRASEPKPVKWWIKASVVKRARSAR